MQWLKASGIRLCQGSEKPQSSNGINLETRPKRQHGFNMVTLFRGNIGTTLIWIVEIFNFLCYVNARVVHWHNQYEVDTYRILKYSKVACFNEPPMFVARGLNRCMSCCTAISAPWHFASAQLSSVQICAIRVT